MQEDPKKIFVNISVLIITYNESLNLLSSIASLNWADDIVVLDSFSEDDTVAVAKKLGARIYQRKFDNFAAQRNYALNHIKFKYDWILHLDADEVVTTKLFEEMRHAITIKHYDAFKISSKMLFFDKWLKYSGMYPVYQVRLGRKDCLRFKQVGHGQREDLPPHKIGTLKESYIHYGFSKGITGWIEKHNRYSTDEAMEIFLTNSLKKKLDWKNFFSKDLTSRRRAVKTLSFKLPFRPLLRFFYMYILRLGFLDGRSGLIYCCLLAIYQYEIDLKVKELNINQNKIINKIKL